MNCHAYDDTINIVVAALSASTANSYNPALVNTERVAELIQVVYDKLVEIRTDENTK